MENHHLIRGVNGSGHQEGSIVKKGRKPTIMTRIAATAEETSKVKATTTTTK